MNEGPVPLRVLLVEDSANDAELVQEALRDGGLEISAQVVANEVELQAALHAFAPDVVLSDWTLPGFSGTTAVAAVHAWDPSVPCILVSGTTAEELVVKALHSGATDYVLKRHLEALAPAVRRALAEGSALRARARAEAELAASEARMRGSLDLMADPFLICVSDRDAEGTITGFRTVFANRAAEAFMGRMPDTLTGAPMPDRIPYLGGTTFFDTFRRVVETGEALAQDGVAVMIPRSDGSRSRGLIDMQLAKFGDGFFAVWRDVTESERLRHERERLAAALEQTTDGVVVVEADGIISYANPAFLSSRGRVRDEVVGRDARALGGAELGPDGLAALLEAIPTGAHWRREVDYPGPDGTTRRLDIAVSPVRDATATVTSYIVMSRDVTALRDAHSALEASEARLRTAFDTMLEGVTVLSAVRDDSGGIVDFRFEYSNPAIGDMSRIPGSSQVGHTLLELFPAHRTNGLFEAYVRVVETGMPYESGAIHYLDPDAAGGPLDQIVEHRAAKLGDGYVLSVRDVTERHRADLEMRRLATAIEQTADAVVITDTDARIEYVNPAFEQVTGYSRAEVLGQNPRILNSGVQGPAFYAAMWAALKSGRSFTGDIINRRKDGTLFQEEAVISPVRDGQDTITSYVAVKRDVTRERASEAARERQARERALIAGALADLTVQPTPWATADLVCRQVASVAGVASAVLYYFTLEGPAMPLAFVRADEAPVPLRRLPFQRSERLRERADEGPWVESWIHRPWHPYDRVFGELGVKALAYVPVRYGGLLIGLLTISSAEANAISQLTESLPALLEFAGFAGALLGPAIGELTEVGVTRTRISQIIREAAFGPVFQPIVDLATGARPGYEALTRFSSGTAPDRVFADARAAGLEAELELATLAAAISSAAGLPAGAWLSLNVSPNLVAGDERLASLLRRSDRPLVLEVTEHVTIPDYAAVRAAIGRLGPGVRVAVDDAGSGVANFGHIVELRPAFVKLDIGLVRGIDTDLSRQALMVGLLHFASASVSQTIAEGVETEEELAMLRELGVPLAQGYLLGRPAPAAEWAER